MARVGEEFPLQCPSCGGDIRLIAFRLFYQCETIPGLRTVGNLRLLRTSCPRSGADPEDPDASWRTARAALDRHSQPLSGTGRKPPKPRERQTGTRSAQTQEKHHRRGMRGVLANRRRTADTPNLAAQGQSVSRKTAIDRAILYPSEAMEPGPTARMSPTPRWSRLIKEQTSGRQDLNLRPLDPRRFRRDLIREPGTPTF